MAPEQIRSQIQKANMFLNNIMETNFAKESLLKDDEMTPKQLTDRVIKELDEHINTQKDFLSRYSKTELLQSGTITESEAAVFDKLEDFDKVKQDLQSNNWGGSTFNFINLFDYKGSLAVQYQMNKGFEENTFIVFVTIEDLRTGRRSSIGEPRGSSPLPNPIRLDFNIEGSYNVIITTNKGETKKLTW
jgi:hypothetical protein